MSDRIEEIRAHLKLLERPHSIRINVTARPPTADIAGVGAAYVSAPGDIAFLLEEVSRLTDACRQYEQAMLAAREKLTELRQQMADSEEG